MSACQDQLNFETEFSKVCDKCKVCGIESLKYVREFYTAVSYCGDISTPLNMIWNKTKRDWLLYLSVIWPLGGGPWPFKADKVPRPSAVSFRFAKLLYRLLTEHLKDETATKKSKWCVFQFSLSLGMFINSLFGNAVVFLSLFFVVFMVLG